ncbi:hypothetical protein [Prauserella endophytica]|uniref:DNA-binding protein n=1 Tax=Prauserella endophytica TaxID=1592324 RepID=A0ABY2RWM4_9PSEU|nr:hypothetical protein [Prauserella endophytica]TKG61572.1 hypothetical protein FCN18_33585 [Prauserella endophytica]
MQEAVQLTSDELCRSTGTVRKAITSGEFVALTYHRTRYARIVPEDWAAEAEKALLEKQDREQREAAA